MTDERARPTPELVERREAWAAGGDPAQCSDTIGKLCAWGYLDGHERHDASALRDAGRAFAAAYWSHYQMTAAARIGGYRELIGGSIPPLAIPDPARDAMQEERFRRLDAQLGGSASAERSAVIAYCVNQHGSSEPRWLVARMEAFAEALRRLRIEMEMHRLLSHSSDPSVRRNARRDEAAVRQRIGELRPGPCPMMPKLRPLRTGLGWIADALIAEKRAARKAHTTIQP